MEDETESSSSTYDKSYADNECRRSTPKPAATPSSKSTWSPSQESATSESSGMSETDASDTSETSSTGSVGTQTRLHSDLLLCNSDGGYVAHVMPCAPTVPHVAKGIRRPNGLRPSEMRGRKYVVDSDLRESADSHANLRDTLEDTIELRNEDNSAELFDQRDESNQEVQAKCDEKHSGEYLNLETRNLVWRSWLAFLSCEFLFWSCVLIHPSHTCHTRPKAIACLS